MHKILFLEYKFRDFTDEEIILPGPTAVMAAYEKLNPERIAQIKRLKLDLGVSFVVVPGRDSCPMNPETIDFALKQVKGAVSVHPDVIWFDYLKFPGKWKILDKTSDYEIHKECKFCKGADRAAEITKLAQKLLSEIPKNTKTGVFTMPLMMGTYDNWEKTLGENFFELGNLFDYVSPMLYHRMISKPVEYIHEHVEYLKNLKFSAEIIPIIQLKDMPDDLEDKLTIDEFKHACDASVMPPSSGLAIFSWDQAIEKNKLDSASEILRKLK